MLYAACRRATCRLQLPLSCIINSRYLDPEHLAGLLNVIGLSIVYTRWREGGKMAYWLLRKAESRTSHTKDLTAYQKKTVLRRGKRNNFVILLP